MGNRFVGPIEIAEQTAPGTPDSGVGALYAKTDGKVYWKDDAGTETDLTGGGAGDAALRARLGDPGTHTDASLILSDPAGTGDDDQAWVKFGYSTDADQDEIIVTLSAKADDHSTLKLVATDATTSSGHSSAGIAGYAQDAGDNVRGYMGLGPFIDTAGAWAESAGLIESSEIGTDNVGTITINTYVDNATHEARASISVMGTDAGASHWAAIFASNTDSACLSLTPGVAPTPVPSTTGGAQLYVKATDGKPYYRDLTDTEHALTFAGVALAVTRNVPSI